LRLHERAHESVVPVGSRNKNDLQVGWLRALPEAGLGEQPVFLDSFCHKSNGSTDENESCVLYTFDGTGTGTGTGTGVDAKNTSNDSLTNGTNTNSTNANANEIQSDNLTGDTSVTVVRARYSFLYLRDKDGEWKIAHHHSSLMPESSKHTS